MAKPPLDVGHGRCNIPPNGLRSRAVGVWVDCTCTLATLVLECQVPAEVWRGGKGISATVSRLPTAASWLVGLC